MRAANGRAGSWAQQRARRIHLDFVIDHWRLLTGLVALLIAFVVITAMTVPNRLATFVSGAGAASVCWYVAMVAVQVTGTTRYMLGQSGEGLTAGVLRPLGRRGWSAIHRIPLEWGDVDHVMIGAPGVVAVETKTTAGTWNVDEPSSRVLDAVCQARYGAERVQKLLLEHETKVRTRVRPLLVLWGPIEGSARSLDGVPVVHGTELREWVDAQGGDALDHDAVRRAVQGIERFVEMREEHARATSGKVSALVEFGPFELISQLSKGVAGFFLAIATLSMLTSVLPADVLAGLIAGSVLVGIAGLKLARIRLVAVGWLSTATALAAMLLGLYSWTWLAR